MNSNSIISPEELDLWIEENKHFQLVDISEENLLQYFEVQFDWMPLSKILNQLNEIKRDIPVVVCCKHGVDSFMLMNILHTQYHINNVLSLKSGVYRWKAVSKL